VDITNTSQYLGLAVSSLLVFTYLCAAWTWKKIWTEILGLVSIGFGCIFSFLGFNNKNGFILGVVWTQKPP